LARTKPDYFETPAPGWTWGSRFSYGCLQGFLTRAGWEIIEATQSDLAGNERPDDRGSAYLLCVPPSYVQTGLAKKGALGLPETTPSPGAPGNGWGQRLWRRTTRLLHKQPR
jgi:hypothetical protein